jgi:hypothetical protein
VPRAAERFTQGFTASEAKCRSRGILDSLRTFSLTTTVPPPTRAERSRLARSGRRIGTEVRIRIGSSIGAVVSRSARLRAGFGPTLPSMPAARRLAIRRPSTRRALRAAVVDGDAITGAAAALRHGVARQRRVRCATPPRRPRRRERHGRCVGHAKSVSVRRPCPGNAKTCR